MTWRLVHRGRLVWTGTYRDVIAVAEDAGLCRRSWTDHGVERAPRLVRDVWIIPLKEADRDVP